MYEGELNEHACAMLSLLTRAAWRDGLPQPLSRTVVRKLLLSGALEGLVLRDVPGLEAAWMERARALLSRVSAVHDCLQAYSREGYRLILPQDAAWPPSLSRLGAQNPHFLFMRGEQALLASERIAVAGSRDILRETAAAAQKTGELIAQAGMTLVTGGARGVDRAAQRGALAAGGNAIIVPAKPAAELLRETALQKAMEDGRLLILCDALPDERFSASKALMRNRIIYALGRETLVVAAREGRGGSWRGAQDCLRGGYGRVRVWDGSNEDTAGCRALERMGAEPYAIDVPLRSQLRGEEQMSLLS